MQKLSRVASGIRGLDEILEGGFLQGASYIIQGRPGAGKTILSNQIAFKHIEQGGRVLFVTLLSESHERLFQALDTLDFFEGDKLGEEITYVGVLQTLREQGLNAVVDLLRKETKRRKATLLVFDGLLNARDRAETDLDVKTFVAEVQAQAAFAGCTVLFLTSANLEDTSPEHTMVDGVIELSDNIDGVRTFRKMQVRKSRGSAAINGLHSFEISNKGITVYPRLESLSIGLSEEAGADPRRVGTGLKALDELTGGGLPRGSVTLLAGPTGSGKTTLGLHFLSEASADEAALHFGFFENEAQLRLKASSQNIPLPEVGSSHLTVRWHPLGENLIDRLAHELLEEVAALNIRRLFIDGFGGFERAADYRPRLLEFFAILTNRLRAMNVTTMATWEIREIVGSPVSAPSREISAVLDNLILLRQTDENDELRRSLSVQKMRESAFDTTARRLDFSSAGIMIHDKPASGTRIRNLPDQPD